MTADANHDAAARCRCGTLEGRVTNASKNHRLVCYCDDCQAFAHWLGHLDLLDARGGSDIVQVAPATLSFQRGEDRIACVRLGEKGMYRWYASCCKTPLGNTLGPAIPYIGMHVRVFEGAARSPDDSFGPVRHAVQGNFAIGGPPPGSTGLGAARALVSSVGTVIGWRLGGKTWPHPYFDRKTRQPAYPVTILSRIERDALRPVCGPHPRA